MPPIYSVCFALILQNAASIKLNQIILNQKVKLHAPPPPNSGTTLPLTLFGQSLYFYLHFPPCLSKDEIHLLCVKIEQR